MSANSNPDMRREFATREELIGYLREQFPEATARDDHVSQTRGGRKAAEQRLAALKPGKAYRETRNYLDGEVSRLSPYIRHGIVSLVEVRAATFALVELKSTAEKFINELAWRDYWQRLYAELGDGIWQDREPYKTGFDASEYAQDLPEDIREGSTELACVDGFATELRETGYLHNHMRMWLAAYVVHWRRVRWQAGAHWFLEHLLDGDPASNNLSWQWVASTFSSKPYIFNRENLEKFSGGHYCKQCPHYGKCAFEGSYEVLSERLFPNMAVEDDTQSSKRRDKRR